MNNGLRIHFFKRSDNRPLKKSRQPRSDGWRDDELQTLRDNWQTLTAQTIADTLHRSLSAVASKASELGLKKSPVSRDHIRRSIRQNRVDIWTNAEKQYLRDNWQTKTIRELAADLGRTWGSVKSMGQRTLKLRKTAEAISAIGQRPNAGQFKKGQLPPNTVYGEERVIRVRQSKKRGSPPYKYIRTGFRQWQEYHRWLWEQHHGPTPEGFNVTFKNGDTMDVRLENLHLMSRRDNALRNSGSLNLADGYVARTISGRNKSLQQEVLNHPDLLELKRTELLLKRLIKQTDDNPES